MVVAVVADSVSAAEHYMRCMYSCFAPDRVAGMLARIARMRLKVVYEALTVHVLAVWSRRRLEVGRTWAWCINGAAGKVLPSQ